MKEKAKFKLTLEQTNNTASVRLSQTTLIPAPF